MVSPRNTKVETSLSKAIHKLKVARLSLYSDRPFALRLMIKADEDLNRAKAALRKSLHLPMKTT